MQAAHSSAKLLLAITITAVALTFPVDAGAAVGAAQICEPGTTCSVGEFLFDDSYAPITSASCTITTRYPDGTLLHNGTAMTGASDGFYSYEFSAPSTGGIYRSQVCCTASSDYLCLDKSFEVKSRPGGDGDIASAVWGYSSRTLSSFGTLVTDIWNNSTRSITSWFTKTGKTVEVSDLEKKISQNRLLLEELVNKPIIETFLEEGEDLDLGVKLEETNSKASKLYVNSQYVISRSGLLASQWRRLSSREVIAYTSEMIELLGETSDSSSDGSILGNAKWMDEQWGFSVSEGIVRQAVDVRRRLTNIARYSGSYGKSGSALAEVKALNVSARRLEILIGNTTDLSSGRTLFAAISEVREIADALDNYTSDVERLLASWDSKSAIERKGATVDMARKVGTVNRIPGVRRSILSTQISSKLSEQDLKNRVFSVGGLVEANKQLLARRAGKSVSSTWLEVGSIIFKTLITNPSELIEQTVPLKYYLPPEVREEDVLDIDDGLELKYDPERDQYYVSGNFTLAVSETQTYSVRVADIWLITEEEVESLKTQATELSRPLTGTSFFAQGVTLKSDIDVSLDKILALQKAAYTPEAKIRAYRESQIELSGVSEKMEKLQDLLTQSGNASSLFGFVGGAQALAVWGLIIIMAAGFVFLAIYMKTLRDNEKKSKTKPKRGGSKAPAAPLNGGNRKTPAISFRATRLNLVIITVTIGTISAMLSSFITSKVIRSSINSVADSQEMSEPTESVLGEASSEETVDVKGEVEPAVDEMAIGGTDIVLVEVPTSSRVNIRSGPSLDADIIAQFSSTREVVRLSESGEWVQIVFGDEKSLEGTIEGFVYSDFVTEADPDEEELEYTAGVGGFVGGSIVVTDTPTGWLRVRSAPWGTEIDKVYPGDTLLLLDESEDWYQVELLSGGSGWIHSDYAELTY